jgi:toxin FitB
VSVLLDTNIVSELRKGRRANARLRAWFDPVPDSDVYLSVLVLGELRRGVEAVRGRDRRQAEALDGWLTRLATDHAERVLPVDAAVADEWGRLSARRTASPIDTLMAATALVHGLVLVTRNVKDVGWTGVPYLNPFEAAPA